MSLASSWGPVAWVVVGETFPLRTRAKQASLATAANWGGNCKSLLFPTPTAKHATNVHNADNLPVLLAFLAPLANAGISLRFGFVFVATNLVAAALVWLFLYESAGLSLENVDLIHSDPNVKARTSAQWAPPGWCSREQRSNEQRSDEQRSNEPLLLPEDQDRRPVDL